MNLKKLFSRRGMERAIKSELRDRLAELGVSDTSDYEQIISALLVALDNVESELENYRETTGEKLSRLQHDVRGLIQRENDRRGAE